MMPGQAELPGMPECETATIAPPLLTPPRIRTQIEILERHDDPHLAVLRVQCHDGRGELLALVTGTAPNDMEWSAARDWVNAVLRSVWYEVRSPF